MSKFQSTISTVAALASIFGAAAAGWKLAQSQSETPSTALDQKIEQLEQKLAGDTTTEGEKNDEVATEKAPPAPTLPSSLPSSTPNSAYSSPTPFANSPAAPTPSSSSPPPFSSSAPPVLPPQSLPPLPSQP